MTPLNRAAWSLAERRGEQLATQGASANSASAYANERWSDFTEDAKAVLQALCEPSDAMVSKGAAQLLGGYLDNEMKAKQVWRAMIVAAFEEGLITVSLIDWQLMSIMPSHRQNRQQVG